MNAGTDLTSLLFNLPVFATEWVLWLLLALSVGSVAVMVERWIFYRRHRIDLFTVRTRFEELLEAGDLKGATAYLQTFDSLATNVVLFGLRGFHKGPDAVEDLIAGAAEQEKLRFARRLSFLATVGSNAPFIGLFGTVLGIIRAFHDLSGDMTNASAAVMSGISEALVATAVGLLVAVPAVVAYNAFAGHVKALSGGTALLSRILLSQLKSESSAEVS